MIRRPPRSTLFPYPPLFRPARHVRDPSAEGETAARVEDRFGRPRAKPLPKIAKQCRLSDPGIGKTTLLREFWEWLRSRSPEPVLHTGRCLSFGRGVTYMPGRSEERRVGKEGRSRWSPYHLK